jgi:hypothetical protein
VFKNARSINRDARHFSGRVRGNVSAAQAGVLPLGEASFGGDPVYERFFIREQL